MSATFAPGDRVTINASRSIPAAISGVVVAVDHGDPLHTPETMVCVQTDSAASLWVYAWRLAREA
jgi:hypothetical protein